MRQGRASVSWLVGCMFTNLTFQHRRCKFLDGKSKGPILSLYIMTSEIPSAQTCPPYPPPLPPAAPAKRRSWTVKHDAHFPQSWWMNCLTNPTPSHPIHSTVMTQDVSYDRWGKRGMQVWIPNYILPNFYWSRENRGIWWSILCDFYSPFSFLNTAEN